MTTWGRSPALVSSGQPVSEWPTLKTHNGRFDDLRERVHELDVKFLGRFVRDLPYLLKDRDHGLRARCQGDSLFPHVCPTLDVNKADSKHLGHGLTCSRLCESRMHR